VKPKTTEAAALLQSRLVLAEYISRVTNAASRLTHSSKLCKGPDEVFLAHLNTPKIKEIAARIPGLSMGGPEPFRTMTWVIRHRLEQNLRIVNMKVPTHRENLHLKGEDHSDLWVLSVEVLTEQVLRLDKGEARTVNMNFGTKRENQKVNQRIFKQVIHLMRIKHLIKHLSTGIVPSSPSSTPYYFPGLLSARHLERDSFLGRILDG
jgi:phosphoenolpyruvate carboxylase